MRSSSYVLEEWIDESSIFYFTPSFHLLCFIFIPQLWLNSIVDHVCSHCFPTAQSSIIYTHHLLSFVWLCFSSQRDMGHVPGPIVSVRVRVCFPIFFLVCFCSSSASSVLGFTLRVFNFLLGYSQTNIRCYLLCIRKWLWTFHILHNLTSRGTRWKWSVSWGLREGEKRTGRRVLSPWTNSLGV